MIMYNIKCLVYDYVQHVIFCFISNIYLNSTLKHETSSMIKLYNLLKYYYYNGYIDLSNKLKFKIYKFTNEAAFISNVQGF